MIRSRLMQAFTLGILVSLSCNVQAGIWDWLSAKLGYVSSSSTAVSSSKDKKDNDAAPKSEARADSNTAVPKAKNKNLGLWNRLTSLVSHKWSTLRHTIIEFKAALPVIMYATIRKSSDDLPTFADNVVRAGNKSSKDYSFAQALKTGNFERVEVYIKNNPGILAIADKNGVTPLMWACQHASASKKYNKYLIPYILQNYRWNIDAQDNNGNTALMYAAKYDKSESAGIVGVLLEHDANEDLLNNEAKTARGYAKKDSAALDRLSYLGPKGQYKFEEYDAKHAPRHSTFTAPVAVVAPRTVAAVAIAASRPATTTTSSNAPAHSTAVAFSATAAAIARHASTTSNGLAAPSAPALSIPMEDNAGNLEMDHLEI